jgi:hypothetical protein
MDKLHCTVRKIRVENKENVRDMNFFLNKEMFGLGVGMDIIHPDFIRISKLKTYPDIQF